MKNDIFMNSHFYEDIYNNIIFFAENHDQLNKTHYQLVKQRIVLPENNTIAKLSPSVTSNIQDTPSIILSLVSIFQHFQFQKFKFKHF